MTADELKQKTSRGETYAELLARAHADWQTPESIEAEETSDDKSAKQ